MVVTALDGLPEELGQLMRNVAVLVEHGQGPPGVLGLYEGIPLTSRSTMYSGVLPDRITIYHQAICADAWSEWEVQERVRKPATPEGAPHSGMGDGRLREPGGNPARPLQPVPPADAVHDVAVLGALEVPRPLREERAAQRQPGLLQYPHGRDVHGHGGGDRLVGAQRGEGLADQRATQPSGAPVALSVAARWPAPSPAYSRRYAGRVRARTTSGGTGLPSSM